jgi:anion-transporting  ArsA/GET3 family ATPase
VNWEELFSRPILVVSGKGGTGKSTVAASLAAAAASDRRVLLAEVEGRGEISKTVGLPDPGFVETPTPLGFSCLSITPKAAAAEYFHIYFGMDRLARRLLATGVVDQLIGAVPGFRDLLACGKLYEVTHVRRTKPRDRGRPLYDLVVLDAPPTGQIASFLSAPATFSELIRVGPMKRQAAHIDRFLRERSQVILVSLLNEMAVAETIEAIPAIRETGVRVKAIVMNRSTPAVLPRGTRRAFGRLTAEQVARVAGEVGLVLDVAEADRLLEGARAADARRRLQARFETQLEQAGPTLALPDVPLGRPDRRVSVLSAHVSSKGTFHVPTEPGEGTAHPATAAQAPSIADRRSLDHHLSGAGIVVVCGSGGVGKTTVSAAVAVEFADRGRETALLTVDPARRLATALGLPTVAGERFHVRLGRGRRLEVMQLDTQRTFDELIDRYALSAERRDRILANSFYRRISNTLGGTNEYMAMEKLYTLAAEEEHEAIVIDTPPTRSALSFLNAPHRLTEFLGGRLLRWMLWPSAGAGRITLGIGRMGAAAFARTAGRLVGAGVLADVAEFLALFEGMYGGFRQRADQVLGLLRSPRCAFLVVTSPTPASLEEAAYFVTRLHEGGMRAAVVVANRWHDDPATLPPGAAQAARTLDQGDADRRAVAAIITSRLMREPHHILEASAMAGFVRRHKEMPILAVPDLPGDVHDVRGLRRVAKHLFSDDASPTTPTEKP